MDALYLWNRTFSALKLDDETARDALTRRAEIRRVEAGQTLIAQDDEDDQVYFLLEGRARVVLYSAKGQEIWIDSVAPGSIVGEIAALTGVPRTSGIVAETLCVVASLSSDALKALLNDHGALGFALSCFLAQRVQSTTRRMFELSALSAKGRVYAELLRMAKPAPDNGTRVINPLPNLAALAKRVSTSRETVSRVIADLEERQLLERADDGFILVDPDMLDRMQT